VSATVAKVLPQNCTEPSPSCPESVQFHPDGEGRGGSCGLRLKITPSGKVVDALDWTRAGKSRSSRRARSR
jgi:hypothetical protein